VFDRLFFIIFGTHISDHDRSSSRQIINCFP
jgi:hypothetical protein